MNVRVLTVILSLLLLSEPLHSNEVPDSCESDIYCRGKLLHDVQMSRIFPDSKTFVDKTMKYPPNEIIKKYEKLTDKYGGYVPPVDVLRSFVNDNFEDGEELELWEPHDWSQQPNILNKIKDENFRDWAYQLNIVWKNLSRRISEDVHRNPELYSLIYVPNGFIIPGGRFKELYYWDTYWIVNGLLVCEMPDTARGVIENLLYLIKTLGHIPNGNRVYYTQRTQPPMITLMVDSYFQYTMDFSIIKKYIHLLDKEMDYWLTHRAVEVKKNGNTYKLFRYFAVSNGPRPESYREDIINSKTTKTDEEEFFIDMKSGAESGWDFSTRWFIENATNHGNLSSIHTRYIIPVDLNALLHKNAKLLAMWFTMISNKEKAKKYELLSKQLLKGIRDVLWNEEEGIWLDYDILNEKPRKYFYLSNFVPFWTHSHRFTTKKAAAIAINYVHKMNLDRFVGGSPASLEFSGEQWDYPNAWPPLQAFFIQGLDRIGSKHTSHLAFHYALKYAQSNYKGFQDFGLMFEKYDALLEGRTGAGGEYEGQSGFGWTNGFIFELLDMWGMEMTSKNVS
nr:trehalase [Halyomorpha halys]